MIQIGISAFYHDSAACLVIDGKIKLAAEEERFSKIKHDASFPFETLSWIFKESKLSWEDIDEVCWYENPELKKDRVLKIFSKHFFKTFNTKRRFLKEWKEKDPKTILENIGYSGRIAYVDHHLSHAAFSFLTSPFKEAAILTVDGVGEWETTSIWHGSGNDIEKKISIDFPNSLGMLYSTITAFLGFKPNEGEYKVMGLAPYGNANNYYDKLLKVFTNTSNKYIINQKYFTWEYSDKIMFTNKLCKLLELEPRLPEEEVTQEHKDLAAALQKVYEYQFNRLILTAKNITNSDNICIGGGCGYNGVANGKITKFNSVHVPFAPSDAGSAIGACLYSYTRENNRKLNNTPFLGPKFNNTEVKNALDNGPSNLRFINLEEDRLIQRVAELLQQQKIVAWFQGRMEFGARALGNRSILASAEDPKMREKLNHVIKKREGFRPFAPSAILETCKKFFYFKQEIPYMNQVIRARKVGKLGGQSPFPSAVHIDMSSRVHSVTEKQNKLYHKLLTEMYRLTGYGLLLNTSFNLKDQTITLSPEDAIKRLSNSDIDYLVMNNYLIWNQND